ncbi:hypothetical protein DFH28DRAFT_50306 [Melampsora americana]|nr:hypothetical protein DFH28DRAFT_50306 [Melampsora americana]
MNPLTSTVTRLWVATKQLLKSLTDWSHGRIDEGGVSDIYMRLGNEFNAASLAFSKEGIDMNDLNSVPDDLQNFLEAALSEDASPMTLEQHLPRIQGNCGYRSTLCIIILIQNMRLLSKVLGGIEHLFGLVLLIHKSLLLL